MVSAVISVEHVQSEDGEWIPINFVLGGILSNLWLHVACASFITDFEQYIKNNHTSYTGCGENGTVRLVDSPTNSVAEGRLEICINREWGTVCNDGLTDNDGFDIDAARVVCRQLGFPEDGELVVVS